jgi:DNA-binding NarL/FixJ family response regulator
LPPSWNIEISVLPGLRQLLNNECFEMSVPNAADGGPNAPTPPRVLIIEDDFLIALELEHRLLDSGIDVVGKAVTAEDAIRLASTEKPDLAIMHIRLAGRRDGVETAIELFATYGIRSIFASAHADNDTRKRASPASPVGWLQKPYSADDLLRLVRGYFGDGGHPAA